MSSSLVLTHTKAAQVASLAMQPWCVLSVGSDLRQESIQALSYPTSFIKRNPEVGSRRSEE